MRTEDLHTPVTETEEATVTSTSSPKTLTDAQQRFVDLDREYTAIIKPFFEQYRAAKEAVIEESGTNAFFQDDQGVVYHTTEKKGQWVDFFPFDIHRTRRGDEKQGSLSLTMAREAGFVVEGK